MSDLGRILIFLGIALVVAGLLILGLTRLHLPFGRLPGDLSWQGKGWSFSFPLATCILLSVLFSLLLWAISRFRH